MQQHPIPQNITGFEFKLIGDMTIKQFAYLAGAAITVYITIISPLHLFIKFPLIGLFVLLGIGLAFIPVEGRPLDRWIRNFIRALLSPSQYIFRREHGMPEFLRTHTTTPKVSYPERPSPIRPQATLQQTPASAPIDEEEKKRLRAINELMKAEASVAPTPTAILSGFSVPFTPPVPPPQPTPLPPREEGPSEEEKEKEEFLKLEEENKKLQAQLGSLREKFLKEEQQKETPPSPAPTPVIKEALAIEEKLQEALSEKERLASELRELRRKLAFPQAQKVVTPTPAEAPTPSEKVKVIAPQFARVSGFAGIQQVPNLVAGIVKDAKREALPNIIIELKDAQGNPVRAFKTNKLGQFSASTPLSNGTYTIELEDLRKMYTFDVISIELKGENFAPLEIIAHDREVNERQQLYRTLFGGKNG